MLEERKGSVMNSPERHYGVVLAAVLWVYGGFYGSPWLVALILQYGYIFDGYHGSDLASIYFQFLAIQT